MRVLRLTYFFTYLLTYVFPYLLTIYIVVAMYCTVGGLQAQEPECELIPLTVTSVKCDSSSKTTTTTSSSSGCSMSPPDDSDISFTPARSDNSSALLGSGHGLEDDYSTSTNRHAYDDPENVAGTTRVQQEMVEMDRVLARIRLRCMDLVSNTSGSPSFTPGTITSSDTVSSTASTQAVTSTDWDTPPRRAAVPRMGVCRRYTDRPIKPATGFTQIDNTTPAFRSLDETSPWQKLNCSSKSVLSHTRRWRHRKSANCSSENAAEDIRETRPAEPENDTISITPDIVSTPTHFSNLSNHLTKYTSCDNPIAIIDNRYDNTSTPNPLSRVSRKPADSRHTEHDQDSDMVDSTTSDCAILCRQLSSAQDAWVKTPSKTDPDNSFVPPFQLNGSSEDHVAITGPKCGRKLDDPMHGSLTTDRKSVPSRETVLESASCSSSTDEVDSDRRRSCRRHKLYWRYADVMITNPDNLEHTIAVQQTLFRQQLNVDDAPKHGAPTAGGDPPRRTDPVMEWVVKRRADGSRYITRRPARCQPGWRTDRRRASEERRRRRRTETTTDGGTMELTAGRHWSRKERRRQVRYS